MTTALEWLELGGPVMLVLLVLLVMSVAALAIILIKCWEFAEQRIGAREYVPAALAAAHRGQWDTALDVLRAQRGPLADILALAVQARRQPQLPEADVREQVVAYAADRIEASRSLFRPLEVIATLAPLLGLLGTVLGMIEAFRRLQAAGDRVDPSILSGGIWEALLTTAVGLVVAIPATAALHALERQVERLHRDTESALTRLFTRPITAIEAAPLPTADAVPRI